MSFSKPYVGRLHPRPPNKKKYGLRPGIFWVMGVNMETACFFCSDFEESGVMQRIALFLDLTRERLPAVILTECQGLWCELFTDSTTVGRDGDAHGGGERRWGDGSRDKTLAALEDTYLIRN